MPSLLLPAPTAGMEPLIVDQLQLVPATLKLPAGGQLHRLDGAHQGTALRFAALAAVDVFAQPACCPADIFRAAALNQFGDGALKAPRSLLMIIRRLLSIVPQRTNRQIAFKLLRNRSV